MNKQEQTDSECISIHFECHQMESYFKEKNYDNINFSLAKKQSSKKE